MNGVNQFIANIYVVLMNVRDTFQFCLPTELKEEIFLARKEGIESAYLPNTAFRKFLDDNKEKGEEIEKRIKEMVEEIYGQDSSILKLSNGVVRVDHSQHLKMYEYIVGINETIRDIILQYIQLSKQQNMFEPSMELLLMADEALYRSIAYKFIYGDLEKSYAEFCKIMNENKGQPSPQANFIVQNEIAKYASELRFIRSHCHLRDNKTLDLMDDALEVLEILEGRRERRDDRQIPELILETRKKIDAYIADAEPAWRKAYEPILNEMMELAKKQREAMEKGKGADNGENKA